MRGTCQYPFRDVACAGGCAAGVCQTAMCGAGVCNTPPASTCADAVTTSVPAPEGTCATSTCSYASAAVICSSGCLGNGCLREADLTERSVFSFTQGTPTVKLALDRGNQPRFAWCDGANLQYRWRSSTGWRTVMVDANLGNCEVAIAFNTATNLAKLAYRASSGAQLRIAEETTPGVFALDVVAFADGIGPAIAIDPAGNPVIAYGTGSATSRTLYVARRNPAWSSQMIGGVSGPATQMVIGANGVIHVLAGTSQLSATTTFPPALYAHTTASGWELHPLATSVFSLRALALDAQDGVTIVTRTTDTTQPSGSNNMMDVLWTHGPTTDLAAERIARTGQSSGFVSPPILLPNAYGETRVIYSDGSGRRKLLWEHWANLPPLLNTALPNGTTSVHNVAVGSDGLPRILGPSAMFTSQQNWVTQLCRPSCAYTGLGYECGSDGCGGQCGACTGGCMGCGENGRCAALPSERILRTERFPVNEPDANRAVAMPDGRVMVESERSFAMIGNTGQWTTGVPRMGSNFTLIAGGGQIYTYSTVGVYRWNGTAFQLHANVTLPLNPDVGVDGAGDLHFIYAATDRRTIRRQRVTAQGTVPAEETIRTQPASNIDLYVAEATAGAAGVVHVLYAEGSGSTKHLIQDGAGAPWVSTDPPGPVAMQGGVVDATGTYWVALSFASGFNGTGYAYAFRTPDGQWTVPGLQTTTTPWTFTSRKLPLFMSWLPSPTGPMYGQGGSSTATNFYRIDPTADTVTQILANLVEVDVAVIDTAGTLHLFGVESPSGVENLRHWWRTATP